MIRDLQISDLMRIEQIHHNDFPLPEINDPSYIVQKTLIKDEKVVGACFARLTSELVLIMDERLSKFSRARLYKEVIRTMTCELFKRNIRTTHVFITPVNDFIYANLLEKHLGFVKATGIPMYLEVK